MLNYTCQNLIDTAEKIFAMRPDPIPRFRLLRDVLRLDPTSSAYQQAQAALQTTKIVQLLESSQQSDGTWGRFHTQDTTVKQPFLTTEGAIAVALSSGLDKDSPLLAKTQKVILSYMDKTVNSFSHSQCVARRPGTPGVERHPDLSPGDLLRV